MYCGVLSLPCENVLIDGVRLGKVENTGVLLDRLGGRRHDRTDAPRSVGQVFPQQRIKTLRKPGSGGGSCLVTSIA